MSKIGFEHQKLPIDHLACVQAMIQAGKSVAGDDLLLAVEQSMRQSLPAEARDIVRRALITAVKTRGRPPKFDAYLDLALDKVDQRYPALLRYEQRKKQLLLKSGKVALKGESPSRLAYARLLRHMKHEFGPMTPEGLGNMHSGYRKGRLHSTENHIDSEDFEAEIEHTFPLFKKIIKNGGFSDDCI
jgi:hypothetical protein